MRASTRYTAMPASKADAEVTRFKATWPSAGALTESAATKRKEDFAWDMLAAKLLSAAAYTRYYTRMHRARLHRASTVGKAWGRYSKSVAKVPGDQLTDSAAATECAALYKEYKAAVAKAESVYIGYAAAAFAKLYIQQETSPIGGEATGENQ